MSALAIWVQASRPKTLIATLSPIIIGSTLAFMDGRFRAIPFLFTLLVGLGIQVAVNLTNDYFDFIKGADTEKRKGPARATQAGLISLRSMKRGIALCFALTLLCGIYLIKEGGLVIALLLLISLALAYMYTGGPFPLAYLGLGDVFVFVFFGPVAVWGTYYLQSHIFSMEALIAGCGPGAISCAILTMNNLRDIEEDRVVNKRTLPVRFGLTFGKLEYLAMILIAALVPFFFYKTHPFALITLLFLPFVFPIARSLYTTTNLAPLFPKTARLLFIYTALFSLGWML